MATTTVILDAGHGGTDPGAIYKERQEKDDALRLTLAVGKILQDNGINVIYTRTSDIYQTPFQKATDANNAKGDYFVSIHRNSSEKDNPLYIMTMELKRSWPAILIQSLKMPALKIWV